MAKSKKTPVSIVPRLVEMLTPLGNADRVRAIRATLTLLGDGNADEDLDLSGSRRDGGGTAGLRARLPKEQAYFAAKDPRTKGEELAVAARYREQSVAAASSTKAEIQTVIKEARKNFDASNYRRDLENARTAGLFTRGTGKDAATLTDYGQRYVDALPDRNAVKALHRPRKPPKRKKKKG